MIKQKKDLILESFQNMNLDTLEILLDYSTIYQGAAKEIFLEKIEGAFLDFKKNGGNFLIPYKGFCISDQCSKKGRKGYSFIGNNSKKHLDLIFDEVENDFSDIYSCYSFDTTELVKEVSSSISINIKNDEMADFKPTVDFLIQRQRCKLAVEELMRHENYIIDKDIYSAWILKHHKLKQSLNVPAFLYSDLGEFHSLYFLIRMLYEFSLHEELAKMAVSEFGKELLISEIALIYWLIKYEKLGADLLLFEYEGIDHEFPEKNEYFIASGLKIKTSDFENILRFGVLFNENYDTLFQKYTTCTHEEINDLAKKGNDVSEYYALSYHLRKKGMLT